MCTQPKAPFSRPLSNHARVLRHIFRNQPVSRSEIGEALSLPRSLVTGLTAALIEHGVVQELGKAGSTEEGSPGRKRRMLGICPGAKYSIGVEIGTRHFRFCLTDLAGAILSDICYAPSPEQIEHVNASIEKGVRELLQKSEISPSEIAGVGIALPGHLNIQSGYMVTHSSLWTNFNVHELEAALQMRVTAENNVRAMAYSKYLFDIKSCPENFVLLHIGAGIFCADFRTGILAEGSYISGEIGHMVSNPDGQCCECGKTGCLQTYASETWLLKKARTIYQGVPRSIIRTLAGCADDITLDTILSAYHLGDELITYELRQALRYLSIAAANIAIVTGAQKLYLHSRFFQNEVLRSKLKMQIENQLSFVNHVCAEDVEILPFEPSRAAVGASALAIDRLFICG